MGIPSYFYQIVRNHGDRFIGSKKKVTRLFLDLNCCIHGCKNRVLKRIQETCTVLPHDFEDRIIREVIQTIIRFCKETEVSDLLWIAVDGVVPLAKMKQQRERRLNAIHLSSTIQTLHEQYSRETPLKWDSNAITPGTTFMLRLCDTIREQMKYIQAKTKVQSIEMNGVRNGGEGEQKIFEYMRNHINDNPGTEDVVYGLDADLIILSLLQTSKQRASISLLREKQDFGKLVQNEQGEDELIRFRVSDFASVIPLEWGGPAHRSDTDRIKDYTVLMSLMGNDFVPHTPSLTFRSEGVERILDAYKSVRENVVNEDDTICWSTLEKIFQYLAKHEITCLKHEEEISLKIRTRIIAGQIPFKHAIKHDPMEQEIASLDWKHLQYDHTVRVGESKWQNRYYTKAIGSRSVWSSTRAMIVCMKREYLKAIQWCWNYYLGKNVQGDWYYQYVTGPLLEDLQILKGCIPKNEPEDILTIRAQAQLVCVLPPQSHTCMTQKAQELASRSVDLYPISHDTWAYGKRHAWECEAFLPRIPIVRINTMLEN
jgi:5'-3' exonuclease